MPNDHQHQQLENLAMRTWGEIVELCHNQGVRVPVGLHELMCKSLRDAFEAGGETTEAKLRGITSVMIQSNPQPTLSIRHDGDDKGKTWPVISIDGLIMNLDVGHEALHVGKLLHSATNGRPEGFDL